MQTDADTPVEWRLVTGCTQGIGRCIAETLARCCPQDGVILGCRDVQRGAQVTAELTAKTGNKRIRCEYVDTACHATVCDLRDRLTKSETRLRAIVNNAAECPHDRQETAEGLERQFATNVLGYHWMIRELSGILRSTAQETGIAARVVNVASHWAGDLDLQDVQFHRRRYDNDTAYRQSKQADRMLAVTWAAQLGPTVLVNACHPGDPCTKLSCALGYNTYATKDCTAAARVPAFLASDPVVASRQWTGLWFDSRSPGSCSFAGDRYARQRQQLFELCEQYSS